MRKNGNSHCHSGYCLCLFQKQPSGEDTQDTHSIEFLRKKSRFGSRVGESGSISGRNQLVADKEDKGSKRDYMARHGLRQRAEFRTVTKLRTVQIEHAHRRVAEPESPPPPNHTARACASSTVFTTTCIVC